MNVVDHILMSNEFGFCFFFRKIAFFFVEIIVKTLVEIN